MADLKRIETRVSRVEHGFSEMREEALAIAKQESVSESMTTTKRLLASKSYQARMVGVFVLGYVARDSKEAVALLRDRVSLDDSWQVQEILAQAFNEYCKSRGYEKSLPVIKEWLENGNPKVRRAVTEGLRIWNQRDYFREHPEVALRLLSGLKDDESEYVRRSAGNAIRDLSRKEKELVRKELRTWNLDDPRIRFTHQLASKFL